MTKRVIAELVRLGELVEVVRVNPGATKSGVCALCETMDGQPVDEIGSKPPFHNHCACDTTMVQMERQPENILDKELIVEPMPSLDPPKDEGGVFDLGDELSSMLENI